jgi:hypothetical protein
LKKKIHMSPIMSFFCSPELGRNEPNLF